MKNLYLLILFLSISLSISDNCQTLDSNLIGGETVDKCDNLVVTEGFAKCCLLSYTYNGNSDKSCFAITEEEIQNRGKAYERLLGRYNGATGTIICKGEEEESRNNSAFLKLSFLSLLLILL